MRESNLEHRSRVTATARITVRVNGNYETPTVPRSFSVLFSVLATAFVLPGVMLMVAGFVVLPRADRLLDPRSDR